MAARTAYEIRKSRILKRSVFDTREEAMRAMAGRKGWLLLSSDKIVEVLEFQMAPRFRSLDGSRSWNYGEFLTTRAQAKRAQLKLAKAEHKEAARAAHQAAKLVVKLSRGRS